MSNHSISPIRTFDEWADQASDKEIATMQSKLLGIIANGLLSPEEKSKAILYLDIIQDELTARDEVDRVLARHITR